MAPHGGHHLNLPMSNPSGQEKSFGSRARRHGRLYGNVIRTGVMLNSTKDTIDELIEALDAAFATV